ncbi:hypothetical protein HDE_05523 [Halotydeus destructor]|nr:hypothetical protein HDE_05523 [Halotydeus destructor]
MSGHEGNTESIPLRCVFLITLLTTFYGFIVLNDNWPKSSDSSKLSSVVIDKPANLQELLQSLDNYYNDEINVEHHDHDEHLPGHDDHDDEEHDDGSHDDHAQVHDDAGHLEESHKEEGDGRGDMSTKDAEDMALPDDDDLTDMEMEAQATLYDEYVEQMSKDD